MILLTPERVPVKVYKWDDVGAPALDKTANCMATIFKACLVTGYGTKEGAGWTLPFEDTAAGVKVLRPAVSPHPDFHLRLSADTGTSMSAQVYLNMTDADTGDLKLQCATPFKYGPSNIGTQWVFIASASSCWFFTDGTPNTFASNLGGIYFYCGYLAGASAIETPAVALQHTGGDYILEDLARHPIHSTNLGGNNAAKILVNNAVFTAFPIGGYFNGETNLTSGVLTSQYIYKITAGLYLLPAFASSRNDTENKTIVSDATGRRVMCHSTSYYVRHNMYVPVDYWEL